MKCKAKWCYNLSKANNILSCIENNGNDKQASLCNLCTKNDNDITNIPETNLPTGPDFPSQSPLTYPAGVLRVSRISDSSMSIFNNNIVDFSP